MRTKQFLQTVFCVTVFFSAQIANAQVGINTEDPKTTLDVTADANSGMAPGITAPRLTGDELTSIDNKYTADQRGAIVYATSAATSPSAKTANITAEGYYYFDGKIWQAMKGSGGGGGVTVTADNGLTKNADNIQLGGTLTKDTEIAQNGKDFYTTGSGRVSVGAKPNANSSKFEVNGASTNTQSYDAQGSRVIDFTKSNLAHTTADAGIFLVTGLKDGGTYTLAVKGTNSGTATFSDPTGGLTFRPVNNGATTAGKQTVYTFVVIGSDAYVWMTKGF